MLRQITACDPLLKDNLCQVYGVLLAIIAKKVTITAEEGEYIKCCELATKRKKVNKDDFGLIRGNETIDDDIDLYRARKRISEIANGFFKETERKIKIENKEFFKTEKFRISKKGKIDVLPFYLATKLMLYSAAENLIPIYVVMRRVVQEGDVYKLDGSELLRYSYNSEKQKYLLDEDNKNEKDEVGVLFDMLNLFQNTKIGIKSDMGINLNDANFETYINSFKSEDLITLIMMAASIHPQYPENATKSKVDNLPDLEKMQEKDLDSYEANLTEASRLEFKLLKKKAESYGEHDMYIKKVKAGGYERTTKNLRLFVDHVRVATLGEVESALGELRDPKNTNKKLNKVEIGVGL